MVRGKDIIKLYVTEMDWVLRELTDKGDVEERLILYTKGGRIVMQPHKEAHKDPIDAMLLAFKENRLDAVGIVTHAYAMKAKPGYEAISQVLPLHLDPDAKKVITVGVYGLDGFKVANAHEFKAGVLGDVVIHNPVSPLDTLIARYIQGGQDD